MILTPEPNNTYITPVQAAELLRVSLATLKKFIYSGRLKTLKTPGGHHRILRNDIYALAETAPAARPDASFRDKTAFAVARGLTTTLEKHSSLCKGHAREVARISLLIAKRMRFSEARKNRLRLAALLHDIGMLDIDKKILNKSGRLTGREFAEVKEHSRLGGEIVKSIQAIRPVSLAVRQHHERYDGSGYPDGRKGGEICAEAKIIAVSDAYASMTAKNYYKSPIPKEEAVSEIRRNSGKQFDPETVEAFLRVNAHYD